MEGNVNIVTLLKFNVFKMHFINRSILLHYINFAVLANANNLVFHACTNLLRQDNIRIKHYLNSIQ